MSRQLEDKGVAGAQQSSRGNRLFRCDLQNALNSSRIVFAHWSDRLSGAALLAIGLWAARSWLAARPSAIAAVAVCGAGVVAGAVAGRALAARLAFHGFDGVLAADALRIGKGRRYLAAWLAIGLAAVLAIALIVRPPLSGEAVAGYLGGAFAGQLTANLAWRRLPGGKRGLGRIRSWARRPVAGVAGALVLIVPPSLAARSAGPKDLAIIAGLEAAAIALALTALDAGTVRFMAATGWSPAAIVRHHARRTLLFAGLGAPACVIAMGPAPAVAVLAVSAAALLLMTLRILAYQLGGKRMADLLVSLLAGILIATAFYAPVLLPFLLVAILWRLGRRAARMTWLLA